MSATNASSSLPLPALAERVARELSLPPAGVRAVLDLLAEGATVPFIARYRKERTGSLDEVQIRAIEERRAYVLDLEERRASVLASVEEQGKLTPELRRAIERAETKSALEDLYAPYRKKRRTRAMIARERGLEDLARRILAQPPSGDPALEARAFVSAERDVPDVDAALAGARDIVAESLSDEAAIRGWLRQRMARDGVLTSRAIPSATREPTRFEQYYEFSEPVSRIPSHRYLAIRRGEKEGVLRVTIDLDEATCTGQILQLAGHRGASPFAGLLAEAARDAYRRLLAPTVETDLRMELKMNSDREAVNVFADNVTNLLLSAPLGGRPVVGIDPGLRTGCKCAAVDATGRFLEDIVIYPSQGAAREHAAQRDLLAFVQRHHPEAIAVGNGTGGRETEAFVRKVLQEAGLRALPVVLVSESGASIYSASDIAREEFPELDLTVRGAISIARRLQDPLAELVKIDPKSIGVGQYQHDVHQPLLQKKLDEVVESCVNRVGVELNTASAWLLEHVAGIGKSVARRIVEHRNTAGPFRARGDLLRVSGLGPRAFEQAAGFLRVRGGAHPLDASAVHPERYPLVERMARDLGIDLASLIGNDAAIARLDLRRYVDDEVGEPTLRDILDELRKPGRDPRDSFEPPRFRDDVHSISDLVPGMQLEGVVTNVTNFGAFVDIGVHQDGLVHISQLADRYVRDPNEVVRTGDRIQVRVVEVDLPRKRISLTARSGELPNPSGERGGGPRASSGSADGPNPGAGGRGPRRAKGERPRVGSPDNEPLRHQPFADLLKRR